MTSRRIFSVALAATGVIGIAGALQVDLTARRNIGPGAMPLIYSCLLLILAVVFFCTDKNEGVLRWSGLWTPPARDGLVFFGLNVLLLALVYLIGTAAAIVVFSIASLAYLKRMPLPKIVLFSVLWACALYVIFVVLLKVPFERGLLFSY
jgi:hypothetical protein